MSKQTFTDVWLRQVKPPETGRVVVGDEKTPGLALRIMANGGKTFFVRGRVKGEQLRYTLGKYPTLGLAEARAEALDVLDQMRRGIDPRKAEEPKPVIEVDYSFSRLLADYIKFLERKAEANDGRPTPRYRKEIERYLSKEFGSLWGDRDVREITKGEMMDVVYAILDRPQISAGQVVKEESPSAAKHSLSYLKTFWAWLEGQGRIDVDVAARLKSPAPSNSRKRVLTDDELKIIWQASFELGRYGQIVRVLMVLAQRRSEVTRLERDDILWDDRVWAVPAERNKSGRDYLVPLTDLSLSVLEEVRCTTTPLLFPAPNAPENEFSAWSKNKAKLNKLCDFSDFVLHDLRRTAASIMPKLGVTDDHVERVLNHAMPSLQGTYNRYDYLDEKRAALELYEQHLIRVCEIKT